MLRKKAVAPFTAMPASLELGHDLYLQGKVVLEVWSKFPIAAISLGLCPFHTLKLQ